MGNSDKLGQGYNTETPVNKLISWALQWTREPKDRWPFHLVLLKAGHFQHGEDQNMEKML